MVQSSKQENERYLYHNTLWICMMIIYMKLLMNWILKQTLSLLRGRNMGRPMNYSDVESSLNDCEKKTKIDIHPHLLRHTHATIYYQETKDIKQVQERLGHAQIQTTMNLYLHPSDEDIRKDWEKAQYAFKIDEKS